MVRRLGIAVLLLAGLSACIVAPPPREAGYGRCPGHWIPGHYGPEGGFHPGHCG